MGGRGGWRGEAGEGLTGGGGGERGALDLSTRLLAAPSLIMHFPSEGNEKKTPCVFPGSGGLGWRKRHQAVPPVLILFIFYIFYQKQKLYFFSLFFSVSVSVCLSLCLCLSLSFLFLFFWGGGGGQTHRCRAFIQKLHDSIYENKPLRLKYYNPSRPVCHPQAPHVVNALTVSGD